MTTRTERGRIAFSLFLSANSRLDRDPLSVNWVNGQDSMKKCGAFFHGHAIAMMDEDSPFRVK
jgi:hypothetical protein